MELSVLTNDRTPSKTWGSARDASQPRRPRAERPGRVGGINMESSSSALWIDLACRARGRGRCLIDLGGLLDRPNGFWTDGWMMVCVCFLTRKDPLTTVLRTGFLMYRPASASLVLFPAFFSLVLTQVLLFHWHCMEKIIFPFPLGSCSCTDMENYFRGSLNRKRYFVFFFFDSASLSHTHTHTPLVFFSSFSFGLFLCFFHSR